MKKGDGRQKGIRPPSGRRNEGKERSDVLSGMWVSDTGGQCVL